jgi:hypothetical protein
VVHGAAAWSEASLAIPVGDVPADARRLVAGEWRHDGARQHAAIAAFLVHAQNLVALGAPPSLIADASRGALDEVRHARACFAIARAIDGEDASPAAFPQIFEAPAIPDDRVMALALMAEGALVDGALSQQVAVRVLSRLAARARTVDLRAVLQRMAEDEERHAAQSWEVISWCVAMGGDAVRATVLEADLPGRLLCEVSPVALDGRWEPWGIPGERLASEEYARARALVDAKRWTLRRRHLLARSATRQAG